MIYVHGNGGHAKVIRDMIPIVVDVADASIPAIVGVGDNHDRRKEVDSLIAEGFTFAVAVHYSAAVACRVILRTGSVIMAQAAINTDTTIGRHVIINTGATVDHDCVIGDYAHIAPGCHLCGGVTVGEGALLGAGTTVIPGIKIGAWAVVGAGSTVIRDVLAGAKVAGNPCRDIAARAG